MPELYLILQIAGAMLALDLIILLFFRWDCIERKTLIVLFADIFICNMVNVLVYLVPEEWVFNLSSYAYTASEIVFIIGITVIIVSMSEYSLPKRLLVIESLYFIALYLLLLTNNLHHLYFQKQSVSKINGRKMMKETPGLFHYMFRFGFLSVLVALFVFALIVYVKRKDTVQRGKRVKMRLLVMGTVIPLFGSILYVTNALEESAAASLSMLAEGVIVMFSLNKYHFLDVVQNAREVVVDTMRLALIIADEEFYYLDSNQYAKTIYPELKELEEGSYLPEKIPEIYALFQKKRTEELSIGGRYYECQISHERGMKGYALCIYDVTEQKKYMEQLERMRQKAEQENEDKSLFLANASHEIRTHMNVILGMSEISLYRSVNPEMEYVLKSIYSAGKGLLDMINGVLDFSKIEAGKMELQESTYSLEKILMDMGNMAYTKLYQKPVEFFLEIGQMVPKQLVGDGSKIRIILTNLLGNAMKYTEEGNISLRVEGRDEEGKIILMFQVKDTGVGMKKEDAAHIFENYTQVGEYTEARAKGTGLGLAITKKMVELMDGAITVESKVGKGTIFQVTVGQKYFNQEILCSQKIGWEGVREYLQNEIVADKVKTSYPGRAVLVVDDMRANALVAAGILELYQLESDIAGSVAEAFAMMEQKSYDMLFVDQLMPEMDGAAMAEQLRKKQDWDAVPMIALTGNRGIENELLLKSSGFDEVLEKPIDKGRLEKILEEYLGQRRGRKAEVYQAYVRELEQIGSQLEQESQDDLENFVIHVHGIKGSSKNLGMMELGEFAEHMELAGRNGETEEVQRELPAFLKLLRETKEQVEEKLADLCLTKEEPSEQREECDRELLMDLTKALEDFNLDQAEEIMKKLQKYTYEEREQKFLNSLQENIENLDYEIAAEKIKSFA